MLKRPSAGISGLTEAKQTLRFCYSLAPHGRPSYKQSDLVGEYGQLAILSNQLQEGVIAVDDVDVSSIIYSGLDFQPTSKRKLEEATFA